MAFADDVQRFADKSTRNAELVHKKIALEVFRRIVERTPVDTGRLRGNWQAAAGVYLDGELDARELATTVAAIEVAVLGGEAFVPLILVNNLPYARRIEYDNWSRQAPNGMVRVTVAEFQEIAGDAVRVVAGE
jgi:hypothetical protein